MYVLLRLSQYPSLYGARGSVTYRVAAYGSQAALLARAARYSAQQRAVVVPVADLRQYV